MLLLVASLIGFVYGMGEEYARLPRQLLGLLPFSSEYIANALDRIIHARRSLGLFGSVLLIWSATAAFDNLQQILNRIHRAPTMPPSWHPVLVVLGARALGAAFNFLLLMTLYRFGPSVRRRYGQIWAGALAGAVLWEASKALFGIYVRSLSSYKMLYGSVGSVIAVLLWLYVSGTIFAVGAEINFVLDARRERRRH